MSNSTPPPGWYPDPQNPQSSRWWDGRSWGPAAPATPTLAAPTHPAVVLGTGVFVLAIASLVFFWIPFLGLLLAAGGLAWSIIALTRNVRTWKVVSATVVSSVSFVMGLALTATAVGGGSDEPPSEATSVTSNDDASGTVSEAEPSEEAPAEETPAEERAQDTPNDRRTGEKEAPSAQGTSDGTAKYGKMPRSERKFVTIVTDGFAAFDKADTDLQQSEAIRKRNAKVCDEVGTTADDWTGVVTDVGANGEGKAWVEIEVAPNITVQTWNNALSDTFDDTLIPPGSSLFDNLVAMKAGDKVTFSGEFVRDDDACVQTTNITQHFSGVDPQFLMRFTAVGGR